MRGVRGLVGWRGQGLPFVAGFAVLLLLLGCSRRDEADDVGKLGDVSGRLQAADWPAEHLVVTNSMRLDQRAVYVGSVAVTKAATGQVLAHNAELALEEDARIVGTARADTVYLGARSQITSDASYNSKQGSGTIGGTSTTPLALPLPISVPALPPMSAGTQAVTVPSNAVQTLDAGSYAAVSLTAGNGGSKTKLRLSGGTYTFASLTLATDSRVECDAPCEIRVVGRALVSARSFLGPAATPSIGPGNVQLLVKGNNAGSGPSATPAALTLDNDSSLHAYVVATNGTMSIGHRVALKGKVVAKDLLLGIDLQGQGLQMPLISQHPSDDEVWEGQTAEFSVAATGPGITYQWQKNGQNIPGATGSTLQIPMAPVSDDGAQIRVVIRNEAGSVTSNPATLTVIPCQDADLQCDGIDEDCDGDVDEDFVPHCVGSARFTCEGGTEVGRACSNGVFCDGAEGCEAGECTVGTPPQEDDNACTVDQCNESSGEVSHSPAPVGTPCDDEDPTNGDEACDGNGSCVPVQLVSPVPQVVCVDAVGQGNLSAKFGHRSPLPSSVTIPMGSDNQLQPTPVEVLGDPTIFEPGISRGTIRVVFPVNSSVSWNVRGNVATADEDSPRCPPQDAVPSTVMLGEGARGHSTRVAPRLPYFVEPPYAFFAKGFSDTSGQVPEPAGPDAVSAPGSATTPQFAPQAVGPMTTVRLFLTSWQILRETDIAGGSDPSVIVTIGGDEKRTDVGSCTSLCGEDNLHRLLHEVEIDPNLAVTTLEVNALDEDPLGDEGLFRDTITIDLTQDQQTVLVAADFNDGSLPAVDMSFSLEIDNPNHFPKPQVNPDFELCAEWTTDFVDEGFGETVTGPYPASHVEYRLVVTGPNGLIEVGATRDPVTGAILDGTPHLDGCDSDGACFLDEQGCVPVGVLDANDFVHKPGDPAEGLEVDLRLRTLFANSRGRIHVRRANPAIAAPDYRDADVDAANYLVAVVSSQNGLFTTDTWSDSGPWKLPPSRSTLANPTLHGMTHAASLASLVLATPQLGLVPTVYRMLVGTGCPGGYEDVPATPQPECSSDDDCSTQIDKRCLPTPSGGSVCGCQVDADCGSQRICTALGRCGVLSPDSCARGDTLFIGPATLALDSQACTGSGQCPEPGQDCLNADGTSCTGADCQCRWLDQSRWKFVNAHEFGHVLQSQSIGSTAGPDYNFACDIGTCDGQPIDPANGRLFDPPTVAPACACAHVNAANRKHCIQSLERVHDAQSEGFAHFFASTVYNRSPGPDPDCTFVYYKEGLESACPDPAEFDCESTPSGVKVLPPYPVSCAEAEKWRNNRCGGTPDTNDTTLAEMGVERDWMQFFRAWSVAGGQNSSPLAEILTTMRQACNWAPHLPDTLAPTSCIDASGARIASCTIPACASSPVDTTDPSVNKPLIFTWAAPVPPPNPGPSPVPQSYFYEWRRRRAIRLGVDAYYTAEALAGDPDALGRRAHFNQMALDRGVGEDTTP